MKLIQITNGYAPYRVDLWNELAKTYEFTIITLSDKESHRQWNIDLNSLKARIISLHSKQLLVEFGKIYWALNFTFFKIIKVLKKLKPDCVIVGGHDEPAYWIVMIWSRIAKIPLIVWTESHILSSQTMGSPVDFVKRLFFKNCDAFIAGSHLSRSYLEFYKIKPNKIIIAPNCIYLSRIDKKEIRKQNKFPLFLYVGRLSKQKGTDILLKAFYQLRDLDWKLILVGGGKLYKEIELYILKNNLSNKVVVMNFLQSEELKKFYEISDVFIFPTKFDTWGIVINEALLAGLYVIGSRFSAAVNELVIPGMNGSIIEPNLTNLIEEIRGSLKLYPFDKIKIQNSIKQYTPLYQANQFKFAIKIATKK